MSQPDRYKEFRELMSDVCRRHEPGRVFGDFLTMAVCAYHHTNIQTRLQEKDEENEKRYMDAIARYEKEEINIFPKMIGTLQMQVFEHPYSDILGQYYTEYLTRGQNGQFFTPEPICDMMTQLHADKDTVYGKTIHDPACGSGRMLLSFAKANPKNTFLGADNNNTCAKMTTVNMFLNGLSGEVSWMNSLSMEWYGGWHINTEGMGIKPIEQEASVICQKWDTIKMANANNPQPPTPANKNKPQSPGSQLNLF